MHLISPSCVSCYKVKQENTDTEIKSGLTDAEVLEQRAIHGVNQISKSKNALIENILSVVSEPMFILLGAACGIYFFLNEISEAFTMLAALLFVTGIDVFQNFRSQKSVKALSQITKTKAKVIRNSNTIEIDVNEVVTRDIIICEEGMIVPADATIISSNDFSVNEAILTGESVAIEKFTGDTIMQGTLVVRGYCYASVNAVGDKTMLSGIGALVATTGKEKTPLQLKVFRFVKVMVIAGSLAFVFVWGYHWWDSGDAIHGLLHGLTMAMSVLPEEIPVALSTFMALGAYRLLKHGVIARSPKTVETLGSASVICVDKTGTLTQNLMQVLHTFNFKTKEEINFDVSPSYSEVLEYAMWASEEAPFDPMEKSIHDLYGKYASPDKRAHYHMIHEFPLSGTPPVMTHIYKSDQLDFIVSCKGGVEGVLKLCPLADADKNEILGRSMRYAEKGLRVLGVARGSWTNIEKPESQESIVFEFLGLITFYDPPDKNIAEVIKGFYNAGVDVKMITGDYKETARAIANQTGIKSQTILSGAEIASMPDDEFEKKVLATHIFARVTPDVKLRIIEALKKVGQIVAMTGDGVNDAPALKSAHIGIAMGKRGTEVAKGAAGLVLADDDLSKMIEAIYLGRRINENLTKAIRYIISIHIPIILLVTLPIFIGWLPAMLFSPIHVIFLELIMGPTCSIIYENEPTPESDLKKPTQASRNLLEASQLWITIVQGLMITLGCVAIGFYGNYKNVDELTLRSYIFATLIFSNIFLTLFNRSFTSSVFQTLRRKNNLIPIIIGISITLIMVILFHPLGNQLFEVTPLSVNELLLSLLASFLATSWIEVVKFRKN
jgi:P-type Ca2+ transporter type 2C